MHLLRVLFETQSGVRSATSNQQPATSNQQPVTRVLASVIFRAMAFCLSWQLGCSNMLSANGSKAGSTAESADPSRPAPISLTDWRAKGPDAFKTPEQPLVIGAGIVFAGQPTYLCFPIEKFGITNAEDIIDITTSCECVTVEKVKYEHADGGVRMLYAL